jgi:VWFA-related protein
MCQTEVMRHLFALAMCAGLAASCPGQTPPAGLPPPGPARPAQVTPGQLAPPPDPATEAPKKSDIVVPVNIVIAPTTVLDKSGSYVNGLQLEDFTLTDNGKPQKITQDVSFEPMSIVVAVQASANLNDILPKIQRIGLLVGDLIVGQNGEGAVLAFDHRLRVMQDFTSEPAKIQEAMKRITPGSTNSRLIDAVTDSVRMLKRRPSDHRRILIMIAEKRDKSSEGKLREALTEAQFANVAIYSLDISSLMAHLTGQVLPPRPPPIPTTAQHFPAGGAPTPTTVDQLYNTGNFIPLFVEIFKSAKSLFVDDALDVFTRYTGGKEYSFVSQKDLEKVTTALGAELHSQYLLSYTPNNQDEGGFHDIRVTVNRPNLEVRTRPGYWIAARPE